MIAIESTEKEIHVNIPRGEMDPEQVEGMRLAGDSEAGWWEKNQERFAPPER